MSSKEAQKIADEKKLDLVKISPNAKPPVCKVMDYSKFKYEQSKKDKEARKKQKTVDLKEIRLSPNTDTHDVKFKTKRIIEFLTNGDKVKVSIKFRGRELAHTEVAYGIFDKIVESVKEYGVLEKPAKMEGRNMALILTPKPSNTNQQGT